MCLKTKLKKKKFTTPCLTAYCQERQVEADLTAKRKIRHNTNREVMFGQSFEEQ